MAPELFTIKKRATFVHIRENGIFIKSNHINIQTLVNPALDNKISIDFTATKTIGNTIKRNMNKRLMREYKKKLHRQCLKPLRDRALRSLKTTHP